MARKRLEDVKVTVVENPKLQPVTLDSMIDSYGSIKDQISTLDKEAKSYNATIKERLKEEVQEIDGKYVSNGSKYVITLTMQDTSKINEEKLIKYLKDIKLAKGIVKKREYIDEKAFEEAVYKGLITDIDLSNIDATCKDFSVTEKLTYKKRKE